MLARHHVCLDVVVAIGFAVRTQLTILYFRCMLPAMESKGEVEKILQACSSQLMGLTEAALADGDFDAVIYVTTVLKRLSHLQLASATDSEATSALRSEAHFREVDDSSPSISGHHSAKGKTRTKIAYPRFRREGSYLVKVGWSKKTRQEYEHRATFEVVLAVAASLDEKTTAGRTASADEVAPSVADGRGDEVPSYQLYLAIAWLRSERLLNRIGRKGYTSAAPGELAARARELWDEMSA